MVRPGWSKEITLPVDANVQGTYAGVRYDRERDAFLLAGDAGSYKAKGSYTSVPFALHPGQVRVSWRPRWTTPLEWDRFPENPILKASTSAWDDTMVSTCSILPQKDALRMFYGVRDRGIGLALGLRNNMSRWTKHGKPVLEAGEPGTFDAGGVLSPAVVQLTESHWYMYYVGYDPNRVRGPIKVHQIGLAESYDQGETWVRVTTEPVLALGAEGSCDGATISSNSVLRIGSRWYTWYTGIAQVPYLASVCLATSDDGIHWQKYPHNPVLGYNPYVETDAFMVATPHVLYEEGVFKMWYNARGFGKGRSPGDYRICYAESLDGIRWERSSKMPTFEPSSHSAWDSNMVEYPEVMNLGGSYYMWYCGNGYGNLGYATGRVATRAIVETRTGASQTPDQAWSGWTSQGSPSSNIMAWSRGYLQMRVRLATDDRRLTPMVQQLVVTTI